MFASSGNRDPGGSHEKLILAVLLALAALAGGAASVSTLTDTAAYACEGSCD
jgi:hypothetical protein